MKLRSAGHLHVMHKIGVALWFILRLGVSVAAIGGGLFMLPITVATEGVGGSEPWQILGFSSLLAVLPWVFDLKQKPKRAVGILGIVMAVCLVGFGLYHQYTPEDCSLLLGRRSGGCVLFNALYSIGGSHLVGLFYVCLGIVFLFFSYRFFKQRPYA